MKNIAKILCFVLSLVLVFTLAGVSAFAESADVVDSGSSNPDGNDEAKVVASVDGVEYTDLQSALNAAVAGSGNVVVEILEDVDLTGIDWQPVTVSAPNYPFVTVQGNGHTITNLNNMLFAGTWAGNSGLVIKNLTIADSDIQNDVDDIKGSVGVGAFVGFPQASAVVTLQNCHLVNSKVTGGHWTGGLVGYAAGYAGSDGPVFMNLTITGCSVVGSTITGKGSAGGVIGHGTGNGWTNLVIEDTIVRDNVVTSTGSSTNKAGAVVGTIGAAGQSTTVNGVTHTGGVSVDATVAGNDVTSNGTVITTIYGRQGSVGGALEIVGGSYEYYPVENDVAYASINEELKLVQGADGHFGTVAISATPEVIDGYWWIGDVNTGMVARPSITIEFDAELGFDCWFVNGQNTGIQAIGRDGVVPQIANVDGYWYVDNNDGNGLVPTGVSSIGIDGVTIVGVGEKARDDHSITYVLTLSNGQEFEFVVTNGVDGEEGFSGPQGPEGAQGLRGPQGLPGADGNDNNTTFLIVAVAATICIVSTLSILLYRGIDRRSWWCTR